MIYVGICMPIGDYILRLALGEIWFRTSGLIFHSFIYQGIFWGILALLHWVYWKDFKRAGRLFFPIIGLILYALFTALSTENVTFFAPITSQSFHLDWVISGYFIPLALAILLMITKRWTRLSLQTTGIIALCFLVIYTASMGLMNFYIHQTLNSSLAESVIVNITPANSLQTKWNITVYQQNRYKIKQYHIIEGWLEEIEEVTAFEDSSLSQKLLLDPVIFSLFVNAFTNPVIYTRIQNEILKVEISEMIPLSELLWVNKIQITKNRSGQTLSINVHYRSLF